MATECGGCGGGCGCCGGGCCGCCGCGCGCGCGCVVVVVVVVVVLENTFTDVFIHTRKSRRRALISTDNLHTPHLETWDCATCFSANSLRFINMTEPYPRTSDPTHVARETNTQKTLPSNVWELAVPPKSSPNRFLTLVFLVSRILFFIFHHQDFYAQQNSQNLKTEPTGVGTDAARTKAATPPK